MKGYVLFLHSLFVNVQYGWISVYQKGLIGPRNLQHILFDILTKFCPFFYHEAKDSINAFILDQIHKTVD